MIVSIWCRFLGDCMRMASGAVIVSSTTPTNERTDSFFPVKSGGNRPSFRTCLQHMGCRDAYERSCIFACSFSKNGRHPHAQLLHIMAPDQFLLPKNLRNISEGEGSQDRLGIVLTQLHSVVMRRRCSLAGELGQALRTNHHRKATNVCCSWSMLPSYSRSGNGKNRPSSSHRTAGLMNSRSGPPR